MQQWFFEDFSAGQVLPAEDRVVRPEDAAWFAAVFAPQPADPAAMPMEPRRSGERLCEWHVAALGMRMIYDGLLNRTASLGSPGIEEVEWPQPVLVGDRLRLEARIDNLRASRTRPDMGLVGFVIGITNQDGLCVMRQSNVILVQRRTPGGGS